MNTRLLLSLLAVVVTTGLAAGNPVPLPPPTEATLTGYDVALVTLDEPQPVPQPNGQVLTYHQAYLVRLFGDFSRNAVVVMYLYFGAERITQYGSFLGGIYFLVYDKAKLMTFAGQSIKYGFSAALLRDSRRQFEPARFDLTTLVPLREALTRPLVPPRLP